MADSKPDQFTDKAVGWAWVLGVLICVGFLVWHFKSNEIKDGIRWIRYGEMWIVSHFVADDYTVQYAGKEYNFQKLFERTPQIPKESLHGQTISILNHLALDIMKWPLTFLIALIGIWAFFWGPGTNGRTVYNLDRFIKRQAKMFPVITPITQFNPSNQPPRPPGSPIPAELPLFAEALGPEEWLAYNTVPVPNGKVDKSAAKRAFARQLGPRWKGAKNLAPYKQIILAACCLKASRKRNEADDILGRMAKCWTKDKGLQLGKDRKLLGEARKILRNKDLAASTLKKCNQHAWETTALIRGLLNAREEGGVLAPAQFVWLRGHDRALWYPLNNLGRQAFHMEAIGAMAHFKAEKLARRPIPRPKVDDAADSIIEYMESDKARPIPQVDYSGSEARGIKKARMAS